MEFATTVPVRYTGTDESWQLARQEFFVYRWLRRPLALTGGLQIGEELRLTLIAIFGALGTLAQYGLQWLVQIRTASTFPYGTLLINLSGCSCSA